MGLIPKFITRKLSLIFLPWRIFMTVIQVIRFYFHAFFMLLTRRFRLLSKLFAFPHFDEDIYRNPGEILIRQGYPMEMHKVLTEDDYILTVWRINKKIKKQEHPVILQHGLLDSSFGWMMNDKSESLAFILADLGYDVWITNNRGNRYSQEHKTYGYFEKGKKFWDFSWDDMAKYDLPANVEYIKRQTGSDKVIYIGHSQGTTQMFAQICLNPDFQKNLKCFIGLGPVAKVGHQGAELAAIFKNLYVFETMQKLHEYDFLVFNSPEFPFLGKFATYSPKLCYDLIKTLAGQQKNNHIDFKRLSVMASHEPAGTSIKNLIHWMQAMRSGRFEMFDHGKAKNLVCYGETSPPRYNMDNLRKFTIPKILIRGDCDPLANETDFQDLLGYLPKESTIAEEIKDYNHLDYIWGVDAKELLYERLVKFLDDL